MSQRQSSPSPVPASSSPPPLLNRQPLKNKNSNLFFPHGVEREFRLASNEMFYLPHHIGYRIPEEEKLDFYKYYKQGSIGDLNVPKPDVFDLLGNKKWWAWHSVRGLDRQVAMQHYTHLTAKYREQGRLYKQQKQGKS